MTTRPDTLLDAVDACAREPIHIPGSIQPNGLLLGIRRADLAVIYATANVASAFNLAEGSVLGSDLRALLPGLAHLAETLGVVSEETGARHLGPVTVATGEGQRTFDAVLSGGQDLAILELEDAPAGLTVAEFHPALRSFIAGLQGASTVGLLCQLAADDIRRMTAFDRVLVYRFDSDWHGMVVGESRNDVLPSCLDLHFPASDIPAQARALYRRNRLRLIADANYTPIPIETHETAPLDLSDSVLRSVSPVHLEYMRNMGTMASMSISIMRDGELWGLVSCHSVAPRKVSLSVRNACDFLTQIFSLQLEAREKSAHAERRMRLRGVQTRLLAHMASEDFFINGLVNNPAELLDLAGATGAAVLSGHHVWLRGDTPCEAEVRALYTWLAQENSDDVFATDSLAAVYPAALSFADKASGLLSISISKIHASYVMWFRPEVVETVQWAGDPRQKDSPDGNGATRLNPRHSFEAWKEIVRGHCVAWNAAEIEAVTELRHTLVGIVLRRAEELAALSDELTRSNKELEAFSYSVSHDLRAPFRHIVGYSELLKKQEGASLSERGRRYVDTIIESAFTAGTLVDHLLSFSQMGRTALNPRRVPTRELVEEVRERLLLEIGDRAIVWTIGDLPVVQADAMMIRLVVENLLSNAVKYTRRRDVAQIAVGCERQDDEWVFFVRDNGVGFDMQYVGKLFGVFQRLHRMEDFEGTGIGLANVRRIVERHGGRTWAEGAIDQGATVFFSLPVLEGAA
ncbi:ATP-binding protein [Microvirga antarctica]|uniref:ATP-binding protein n=1 Tax=Microvirga antarctica TaxID=2819233 RepID=UPI001B30E35A|nr:ATP-binding protein [Microvirga antarctica]